jgi:hypothetical protein
MTAACQLSVCESFPQSQSRTRDGVEEKKLKFQKCAAGCDWNGLFRHPCGSADHSKVSNHPPDEVAAMEKGSRASARDAHQRVRERSHYLYFKEMQTRWSDNDQYG